MSKGEAPILGWLLEKAFGKKGCMERVAPVIFLILAIGYLGIINSTPSSLRADRLMNPSTPIPVLPMETPTLISIEQCIGITPAANASQIGELVKGLGPGPDELEDVSVELFNRRGESMSEIPAGKIGESLPEMERLQPALVCEKN